MDGLRAAVTACPEETVTDYRPRGPRSVVIPSAVLRYRLLDPIPAGDDSLLAAQSEPVIDAEGDEHRLDDRIAAVRSGSKVVILDFNVALSPGKISEQMTRSIVMAAVRRLEESR